MSNRVELVLRALTDPEIGSWYLEQHGVIPEMITASSVRSYGLAGLGEIASQIIADGIEAGVISKDETEAA
jgi:hypothetical protein